MGVEQPFPDLDEGQVAGHHRDEGREEAGGQLVEAEVLPTGVAGSMVPTATTPSAADVIGRLGRLRKNGTRRVRMAKITRVWVASDSTNQPERNCAAPEWKTHSMTAKVAKSNSELIGYRQLAERIADIGYIAAGSITHRYTRCGTASCRCHANPPQPHGPYWQWTAKIDGKTATRRLSETEARLYQQWIDNDRQLRALIDRMRQVAAKAN